MDGLFNFIVYFVNRFNAPYLACHNVWYYMNVCFCFSSVIGVDTLHLLSSSSRHMAQGSSEVIHYRWLVLLPSLPLVIWHKVLQR